MKKKILELILIYVAVMSLSSCSFNISDSGILSEATTEPSNSEIMDTTSDVCQYNTLIYSDEYIDVTLVSITNENAYFSVTSNSKHSLAFDIDHIQLDGTEYTYEASDDSDPYVYIDPKETIEYQFCDSVSKKEIDFTISKTNCKNITGVFEIWEDSMLTKLATVTDFPITGTGGTSTTEDDTELEDNSTDLCEYGTLIYSDDQIDIVLLSITKDNAFFSITNHSDDVFDIEADHFQLDDIKYTCEDTNYSNPTLHIAPEETRVYEFCDYDYGNKVDFEITDIDCSRFSGVFDIWYYSDLLKTVTINDVDISRED